MDFLNNTPTDLVDTSKPVTNASLAPTAPKNNTRNSAVLLTATQRDIIQSYIDGSTRNDLAEMYSMDLHSLRNLLEGKEARAYYREMNVLSLQTDKNYRLNLMGRIAEAKIEEHLDSGESLASITKKDVIEIFAEMDKQQKEVEKSALGTTTESVYLTILNQVTGGNN